MDDCILEFFETSLLSPQQISLDDLLESIRPSSGPSELFNAEMLSNRDLIRQVYTNLIENGFKVKPFVPPATGYAIKLAHVIYPGDAFKKIRDNTVKQVRVIIQNIKKSTPARSAAISSGTSGIYTGLQYPASECTGNPVFSRPESIYTQARPVYSPYIQQPSVAPVSSRLWPNVQPSPDPYVAQSALIEASIKILIQ